MEEQDLLALVAIGGRGAGRVAAPSGEIADALQALAAEPGLEDIVEIARRLGDGRSRYQKNSWEHIAHARAGKALKRAKVEAEAAVAQKVIADQTLSHYLF